MPKELILTVGLPRSGKTTWAKQQEIPIVNPDSIRLAIHGQRFIHDAEPMVWTTAKYMVRSLFLAGHDKIIVDATNTTAKRRQEWIDESGKIGCSVSYHVIPTSAAECIARAKAEGDEEIIPIIEHMAKQWDMPNCEVL
jgi:predicted kinase